MRSAPSGSLVFGSYITAGNHPGRKVFSENGTYRLKVFAQSNNPNHVGTYGLRVRSVPADQIFAIQAGELVTNNLPGSGAGIIDVPGAQDVYTFNASAGQSFSFDAISESTGFAGWLQWEARTPSGQLLFGNFFDDVGRKTLTESGTYKIRVWVGANNTGYLGNYAFRIIAPPGDVNLGILKGDVVSNNVPAVGAGNIEAHGALEALVGYLGGIMFERHACTNSAMVEMFQFVEFGKDVIFDGFGERDVVRRQDQFHGCNLAVECLKIQSGYFIFSKQCVK